LTLFFLGALRRDWVHLGERMFTTHMHQQIMYMWEFWQGDV